MQAAYARGTSDVPLRGETIGEMFTSIVASHADREALVSRHQDIRRTYSRLDREVERCARALLATGLDKGDRVGIWSPNNAPASRGSTTPMLRERVMLGDGWRRLLDRAGEVLVDGLHEREETLDFDDSINIQ